MEKSTRVNDFAIEKAKLWLQETIDDKAALGRVQGSKFWKEFEVKVNQAVNEVMSYKRIREIRKQVTTDMTEFIINNKYQHSALMK